LFAVSTLNDFLKLRPRPALQCPVANTGLSLDLDTPEDYKEAMNLFNGHEKPSSKELLPPRN